MNEKIKLLLEYELNKYRRKGVVSSIIGFILLLIIPNIVKVIVDEIYKIVVDHKVLSYDNLMIIGLPVFHFIVFISYNLFYFFIYYFDPEFIRKYKCNQNEWPFNDMNIWAALKHSSIIQLSMNILLINPVLSFLSFKIKPIYFKFEINDNPDLLTSCLQILFFFLINDFVFHFSHKMLHTDLFYKSIHYKHHEFKTPISISAEYAHPVEYIMGNIIPASLGPLILNLLSIDVHLTTIMIWTIIGIGATLEQHSGYEFTWSPFNIIPFTFSTYYHDFHHTRFKGNYSSNFILWDFIFSNNIEYMVHFNKLK